MDVQEEHILTAIACDDSDYEDTDVPISPKSIVNGYFYRLIPANGEHNGYFLYEVDVIQEGE